MDAARQHCLQSSWVRDPGREVRFTHRMEHYADADGMGTSYILTTYRSKKIAIESIELQ